MAPQRFLQDQEARVQAAVHDVKNGVRLATASRVHSVPRTTVRHRLEGKPSRRGPSTVLTEEEENLLVTWVINCSRKGFPRRKLDLLLSVKEFFDKDKSRQSPFKNNMPGDKWYRSFLKRHPELAKRTPEGVSRASGNVSEADIRQWFKDINDILVEENAIEVLKDPSRIANADESNFRLCPKKSSVLAEKGCKDVYEVDQGDPKFAITAMFAFFASGKMVDPMLIFPYQRIPPEILRNIPESWGVGRSESGWMTAETFYEWIGNIFGPYLIANNIKLPVILYVDGHKTHLTRDTSQLCKDFGIILIALYPNSTHILQPCDVAAFRPLKAAWSKELLLWRKENPTVALTKLHIAPILKKALQMDISNTVKNGFRATGLYPFDANAVNFLKCKGHNNKSTEEEESSSSSPSTSLSLDTFRQLVGADTIVDLENQAEEPECPAEAALLRVYMALGGKSQLSGNHPKALALEGNVAQDPPEEHAEEASVQVPAEVLPVNLALVRREPLSGEEDPDDPQPGTSTDGLRDVLMWPHSPKRKGKRQAERTPYVVTSKRWMAMHTAKEEKRAQEAQEKEARKQDRLAKRAEKAAENAEKAKKAAARRANSRARK